MATKMMGSSGAVLYRKSDHEKKVLRVVKDYDWMMESIKMLLDRVDTLEKRIRELEK